MTHACSRRDFFGLSCGGYVAYALAAGTGLTRRAFAETPATPPVVKARFAFMQKLADGVWSATSTPVVNGQVDGTTFSNGGIIAGKDKVVVIEGFNTPKGAAWQADACKELTGRYPTHVVLTHFHPDHSAGLAGYQRGKDAPDIVATHETRRLLLDQQPKEVPADKDGKTFTKTQRKLLLPDVIITDLSKPTVLDLGGKTLRITPRAGHTPSDVTISIDEPRVMWCGDLFFNGLFPYYGDAVPTQLDKHVAAMIDDKAAIYVPGHGPNTDAAGLTSYLEMLRHVEQAARAAHKKGVPAADAWPNYEIPASLGKWMKFREDVYSFAFVAWERELNAK